MKNLSASQSMPHLREMGQLVQGVDRDETHGFSPETARRRAGVRSFFVIQSRPMRPFRTTLFALVLCFIASTASATWSVIALDRATGRIVVSSAPCVTQQRFAGFPARDLRDIQAIVV